MIYAETGLFGVPPIHIVSTYLGPSMIVAVGLDIVEVVRIERAMKRSRFLEKILTENERAFCRTPQQVAGRWAAKEAAMKCMGRKLTFRHFEILGDPSGAPRLHFRSVPETEGLRAHVSISHERGMAAAVVVLERI